VFDCLARSSAPKCKRAQSLPRVVLLAPRGFFWTRCLEALKAWVRWNNPAPIAFGCLARRFAPLAGAPSCPAVHASPGSPRGFFCGPTFGAIHTNWVSRGCGYVVAKRLHIPHNSSHGAVVCSAALADRVTYTPLAISGILRSIRKKHGHGGAALDPIQRSNRAV
jgi:hypothetical protein